MRMEAASPGANAAIEPNGTFGGFVRSVIVVLALAGAVVFAGQTAYGADGYQLLRLDDHLVKWGSPKLGSGATVRYAFATNAMHFNGAHNCGDIGALDQVIGAAKIKPADFATEVMAAFAMWQRVAAVTFQPAGDPETADIVIGALANPHGSAFADVFYDRTAEGSVRTIKKAPLFTYAVAREISPACR